MLREPDLETATRSAEETRALGEALGRVLGAGAVVCLVGELGAGKTVLAQGIARGLGVREQVTSPSFVLIREYRGRLPVYHMDLYRLACPAELEELGPDEYFYGDGVTLVEWADAVRDRLPEDHLRVELARPAAEAGPQPAGEDENVRRVRVWARGAGTGGPDHRGYLERLREAVTTC